VQCGSTGIQAGARGIQIWWRVSLSGYSTRAYRPLPFWHNLLMCGRYRLSRRKQIVEEHFASISEEQEWEPRYNVAPTQSVPIIRQHSKKPHRELSLARWGLVPSWAKDSSAAARMINARSETADTKPAFRDVLKFRRCLIPADAFYEWLRHEAACVIVRRARLDRTCHPIGSTLRGVAFRKRIV
jgi:hypothetical protein